MTYRTPSHIAETIRNSHQDSMFIYDLQVLRTKMNALACLPDNVDTFYAMKVNPHVDIVREALEHKNISGIEVASLGEMQKVLEAGEQSMSRVIYTGPSKNPLELQFSVEKNIKYLNVESIVEAVRINEEAKRKGIIQPILLRLNTKHTFNEGEAGVVLGSGETQFGVPQGTVEETLKLLNQLSNIKVEGFHMYPATGVLDADVLLGSVEASFEFLRKLEDETGVSYKTLDFGGGFGVDYGGYREFDIQKYSDGLEKLIQRYSMSGKTLLLELGRYLGADMGYFATKINDIKTIGKNTEGTEVKGIMCHAGTNAHKRPQVLGVDYHIDCVQAISETEVEIMRTLESLGYTNHTVGPNDTCNIYGSFCTSVDYLAKGKKGLQARIGDYIVMPQAGAYGLTMSPQHFLSHPKVPEIILR